MQNDVERGSLQYGDKQKRDGLFKIEKEAT